MVSLTSKLLIYWHGKPIPAWRQANTDRLIAMYPDAEIIRNEGTGDPSSVLSDKWRAEMCATHKYCLWVDSDIWLPGPLPIDDLPAMADEYHIPHWSICWSGANPGAFAAGDCIRSSKNIRQLVREKRATLIGKHYFIHSAMDQNGEQKERAYA